MSGAVDSTENSRRKRLVRLVDKARTRGLRCALTGPDGDRQHLLWATLTVTPGGTI
jgi:hypothetical protein